MPQIPQCCCDNGSDTGHCWGCNDGTWFGYTNGYDAALADCQANVQPGGGAHPYMDLGKVPNRQPQPSVSPVKRRRMNFTNNRNSNATWSGAQTNVGPQDRIYAGNYASGTRGNVQNNCIVARQEGGGLDCSKFAPAGSWKPCWGDPWSCCRGPAMRFDLRQRQNR